MAECGLLNLATCLPEKFFQYLVNIINAPIKPLLSLVKGLLSEPISLSLFVNLWAIIIYLISMFYGLFLLYSGFNFMISGHDVQKREQAKTWLRNIVIMIILVQASFLLYEIAIELSSILTTAVLSLLDKNFFLLTFDNIINIGLQLIFFFVYLLALLLTAIILIIRYVIVAVGVVFFPIGIFFYFIPPLRQYGSLILNFLGIAIFITFFDAIILIGFSKLLGIQLFSSMKILVMISAFLFIDALMFFLMFFSLIKAGFNLATKIGGVVSKFT
ncbi:hypothetical protein HYV49_04930 [Candidatus Pacearchaeota archaeon]|nr:hypothetical protein [Candidatus Pacearchaeota archaeon]